MVEKLYPRQLEVLYDAIDLGSGCINVPMGFGKTIISLCLAIHNYEKTGKASLIIASKTLISNWVLEIKKFLPNLKYVILHSNFVKKIDDYKIPEDTVIVITTSNLCSKYYTKFDIQNKFITAIQDLEYNEMMRGYMPVNVKEYGFPTNPYINYNGLENNLKNINNLKIGDGLIYAYKWSTLIIDEIQNYTNITVAKCRCLCSISAISKWGLSGTLFAEPKIENILGYYILTDNTKIPRRMDKAKVYLSSDSYTGYLETVIFRESIENTKLPDVEKIFIHNTLTKPEENVYKVLKDVLIKVSNYANSLPKNSINYKRFSSYKLVLVSYLRQMLIIPLLPIIKCFSDSIDINNDSELTQIVLDEFKDVEYLNNLESIRSSRLREIENVINKHNTERILIFTSFRSILKILKGEIRINTNRMLIEIESKHTMAQRAELVENFRNNSDSIMFLTYDIGAEGLNLQFCNIVLFTDTYWNVSKIEQAGARVLRPGNTFEKVYQYYFISNTAIESGMLNKQSDKLKINSEIKRGKIVSKIKSLSNRDIIKILEDESTLEDLKKNFS